MGEILPYRGTLPRIAPDAFVAPGAVVIGDVEIGSQASLWFGCVARGDVNWIRIGARSNVQDGTVIHVHHAGPATAIGAEVTVGHGCIIHACTLGDRSFIGMGATVMDGVVVEPEAMIAAGALVTPGKRVPSRELWAGAPARFLRPLRPDELDSHREQSQLYVDLAAEYLAARAHRKGQ